MKLKTTSCYFGDEWIEIDHVKIVSIFDYKKDIQNVKNMFIVEQLMSQ